MRLDWRNTGDDSYPLSDTAIRDVSGFLREINQGWLGTFPDGADQQQRNDIGMTSATKLRTAVVLAPLSILLYGGFRFLDGLDNDHGPGLAWNIGHGLFLAAFLAFAVLLIEVRTIVVDAGRPRWLTNMATALGLLGVACFTWVILGDLFPNVKETAGLPDPLMLVGPLAFQLGLLTLLGMLVRLKQVPIWSPILVFVGFLLIAANLNLLPLGALALMIGLKPLAVTRASNFRQSVST